MDIKLVIKYLTTLELPVDAKITKEQIDENFLALSHIFHPDSGIARYSDGKKLFELIEAYRFLIANLDGINKIEMDRPLIIDIKNDETCSGAKLEFDSVPNEDTKHEWILNISWEGSADPKPMSSLEKEIDEFNKKTKILIERGKYRDALEGFVKYGEFLRNNDNFEENAPTPFLSETISNLRVLSGITAIFSQPYLNEYHEILGGIISYGFLFGCDGEWSDCDVEPFPYYYRPNRYRDNIEYFRNSELYTENIDRALCHPNIVWGFKRPACSLETMKFCNKMLRNLRNEMITDQKNISEIINSCTNTPQQLCSLLNRYCSDKEGFFERYGKQYFTYKNGDTNLIYRISLYYPRYLNVREYWYYKVQCVFDSFDNYRSENAHGLPKIEVKLLYVTNDLIVVSFNEDRFKRRTISIRAGDESQNIESAATRESTDICKICGRTLSFWDCDCTRSINEYYPEPVSKSKSESYYGGITDEEIYDGSDEDHINWEVMPS